MPRLINIAWDALIKRITVLVRVWIAVLFINSAAPGFITGLEGIFFTRPGGSTINQRICLPCGRVYGRTYIRRSFWRYGLTWRPTQRTHPNLNGMPFSIVWDALVKITTVLVRVWIAVFVIAPVFITGLEGIFFARPGDSIINHVLCAAQIILAHLLVIIFGTIVVVIQGITTPR